MYQRTHPFMIVSNLRRVVFLTILPVLRGLLSALQMNFFAWLQGAWIDLLTLSVMVAIATLHWYRTVYAYDGRAFTIRTGLFIRRETVIFWDRVTVLSMIKAFYLKPFHAVYLRADTIGGSFKKADLALFLSPVKARELVEFFSRDNEDSVKRQFIPDVRSILTMSVLTSNSFAGVVFIATFVSQSGKLLGNEFSDMLVSTFEEIARILAFGLPPAAAAIAYILLGGWMMGFLKTFVSYRGFRISRGNADLNIQSGMLTQREYSVRYDRINFIDVRQNIAAKALKLYSLYISAIGYGKVKDDISCVIPNKRAHSFEVNRKMLFPSFLFADPVIRSPKKGILRFIGQPLTYCLGILLAMWILIYLFPSWIGFITFTGLMSTVPIVLILAVRIVAFRTGGAAKAGDYYTFCYSSGFNLHTVVVPASKIVYVQLRQSYFQARDKVTTCDLVVYTVAEGQARHLCRNLPLYEVERLFDKKINPV